MVLSAWGHKAYVEASIERGWLVYYFYCIDMPKESYKSTSDNFTDALYDAELWLHNLPPAEQALSDEAFEVGISLL
jgi:hypothetical protein